MNINTLDFNNNIKINKKKKKKKKNDSLSKKYRQFLKNDNIHQEDPLIPITPTTPDIKINVIKKPQIHEKNPFKKSKKKTKKKKKKKKNTKYHQNKEIKANKINVLNKNTFLKKETTSKKKTKSKKKKKLRSKKKNISKNKMMKELSKKGITIKSNKSKLIEDIFMLTRDQKINIHRE